MFRHLQESGNTKLPLSWLWGANMRYGKWKRHFIKTNKILRFLHRSKIFLPIISCKIPPE